MGDARRQEVRRIRWQTRGLELACRVYGSEGAPAIVMLHGFLDTGAAFGAVAATLSDRWRVYVPDQRGFGASGRIGAGGYYHFPDYVLDVDGLLRAEGLDDAVLVGHSMGATVAAYFAGAFPERARGLVLLDGIGPPWKAAAPEDGPARMRRWIEDVRRVDGAGAAPGRTLEGVAERIGRISSRADRERLLELAREAAEEGEDGLWRMRYDPLHRTQAPISFEPARFRAFLARVACPVLCVWAEESPMRGSDEAERKAALGDLVEETIPGTGHNLHHEQPEAVGAVVRRFLEARVP